VVEAAIDDVRDFLEDFSDFEEDETCDELLMLQDMLENLKSESQKPNRSGCRKIWIGPIAVENYERAAMLRDELNNMLMSADGDSGPTSGKK
jgi:hypothetical protein